MGDQPDKPATIYKPMPVSNTPADDKRDIVLTHLEAEAAGPMDIAACGEEDPGAALESLVSRDDD